MNLNKTKGSVLILMLAVVSLILVLGTTLILVNTSTYKVQTFTDTVSRVNYMAESGIEVALATAKKNGINSINSIQPFKSNDQSIECTVTFISPNVVSSTATNGKITKTLSALIDNSIINQGNNPFTDNVLNIYGDMTNSNNNFSVGNGSNTSMTINGSTYIQSYSANIKNNLNINNGDLTIVTKTGNISFDNNGSIANILGKVFLQSNNITLSQNITVGTDAKPSSLTMISNNFINFDNNGTTSTIYGTTYVKSNNGIKMEQNLNVNKGDLIIDNASGNVEFTNNSNIVNVYGASQINSNGDILLRKAYTAGTPSHQSNLVLNAGGNVDLYNTTKNIYGNFYISSGSNGNNTTKISNTGKMIVGGWVGFISKNNILNDWGNSNSISGDYYLKAYNNININNNIDNYYKNSYSVIAGKNLYYANNDFSKEKISKNIYLEINNNIDKIRSTVSSPAFVPTKPSDLQLPQSSNQITDVKNIYPVTNSNNYNVWDNSYSDLAFIKIYGSNTNDIKNAINSDQGMKYKLILIDGDYTMSQIVKKGDFDINNTIIYCTGKFIIDNPGGNINFNHSVVFSKGFNFNYPSINMMAINQPRSTPFINFTINTANEINSILSNNINGYENINIQGN